MDFFIYLIVSTAASNIEVMLDNDRSIWTGNYVFNVSTIAVYMPDATINSHWYGSSTPMI